MVDAITSCAHTMRTTAVRYFLIPIRLNGIGTNSFLIVAFVREKIATCATIA